MREQWQTDSLSGRLNSIHFPLVTPLHHTLREYSPMPRREKKVERIICADWAFLNAIWRERQSSLLMCASINEQPEKRASPDRWLSWILFPWAEKEQSPWPGCAPQTTPETTTVQSQGAV